MSTRGCYRFNDGSNFGSFTVYKHSDNYPWGEHGGIAAVEKALDFAWPLPRFEADEFAAAFVAANKESYKQKLAYFTERGVDDPKSYALSSVGGGVRLLNTPDTMTLEHMPGDIEYLYDVSPRNGKLYIVVSEISGGWNDEPLKATPIARGTLAEMRQHFAKKTAA